MDKLIELKLGRKAKCLVTGFEGVLVSKASYLHGVDRWAIQPPVDKDGKVPDDHMFDETQLRALSEEQVIQSQKRSCVVELGQQVKDTVSGEKGTVIGVCEFLNGCWRVGVTPKKSVLRGRENASWFDDGQLEILTKKHVEPRYRNTGGPVPSKPNRGY